MTQKKTILIFGISSFLGSNLAELLKDDYRIVGTYFNTPVQIPDVLTVKCDVHEKEMVQKITYLFQPDITVYAVGLSSLENCQEFPKVADALNTVGVFNVSAASERYHSKFVYFSSGYIASGENVAFKENDTPMPSTVYGNTIASSEFYIQKSCLNYVILRCCPIFGKSFHPMAPSFIELIDRNEFLGQKVVCDNKIHTGFIDIYSLVEIFKKIIEMNATNRLFQVSSSDVMTRYDFAKLYLESLGGNTGVLAKGDWKFPRSENALSMHALSEELYFKMDTSNIESEVQIQMKSVAGMIENYKKRLAGKIRAKRQQSTGISYI
ncbi:MAG: hypothetical protein CME62_02410 [Halobacteriovoraceae bacterium]|nr:hypothetical protein [Halobacteriovoraceae bacterium]|tara:strand:- start:27931 stop:28899 length:969 start_codon:yes stop_codon:yes gene_type:complete